MFETPMTVVGNVISEPSVRTTSVGEVVSFRMASNSRRRDADTNEWINDKTLYLSVSCWRKLASGVAASVEKGRPVIATGTVRTAEYTTGASIGSRRSSVSRQIRPRCRNWSERLQPLAEHHGADDQQDDRHDHRVVGDQPGFRRVEGAVHPLGHQ